MKRDALFQIIVQILQGLNHPWICGPLKCCPKLVHPCIFVTKAFHPQKTNILKVVSCTKISFKDSLTILYEKRHSRFSWVIFLSFYWDAENLPNVHLIQWIWEVNSSKWVCGWKEEKSNCTVKEVILVVS